MAGQVESVFTFISDSSLAVIVWFAAAAAIALVVHEVAVALLRNLLDETGIGRAVLDRGCRVTRLAIVLLGVALALPSAQADPAVYETVRRLLRISIAALLGWAAVSMINTSANLILSRHPLDHADNLTARRLHTQIQVLRRLALVIVILVTAGVILMSFPVVQAVGYSLFASAGVAGIVLGFAARPVLANLIAGIQLALTQPIRIDDVVIVEGEWGRIEEIATTYVVVRVWDLRRLIVPLSHFIEKPFENWTRESAALIGSVTWHVDYRAPLDAMRAHLNSLVEEHGLWDGQVAKLQVVDAEKTTMKVRALVSARNSSDAWDLRCDIREKMIVWLQVQHPVALPRVRANVETNRSNAQLDLATPENS